MEVNEEIVNQLLEEEEAEKTIVLLNQLLEEAEKTIVLLNQLLEEAEKMIVLEKYANEAQVSVSACLKHEKI